MVKNDEPKAEVKATNRYRQLDRSYDANTDISITDNTGHIAAAYMGRASDWSDDYFEVPSLWNVIPIVNQSKSLMLGMEIFTIFRGFRKAGR